MVFRKTLTPRIWIESTECQRSSSGKYSQESQRRASSRRFKFLMRDLQCEPEHSKDRIIFMSMYNDIEWEQKETKKYVNNSQTVANYARKFPRGHWSFLGPGSEQKWYGTQTSHTDHGINLQRIWWQISLDSVIQHFVPPVPLREENSVAKEEQEVNTLPW